jgi:dynein heavy chain, axonemal
MKLPADTEELVELMKYIENAKIKDIVALRDDITKGKKRLDFLLQYAFLSEEDIKLNGVTFTWPSRILPIFELSKKRMVQKKAKAQDDLKVKIQATTDDLDECLEQVTKFQVSSDQSLNSNEVSNIKFHIHRIMELWRKCLSILKKLSALRRSWQI